MIRIPIDVAAPIACTASSDELPIRIEQVTFMRDRLRTIDRTPDGLVLHFAPDDDLESHLQQFAVAEKGCCRFWGFAIARSDDDLTLAWDGPDTVQGFLDELAQFFRSDEPLTAFSGLL